MSFMGRNAPGAAGGAEETAGGDALAGADVGEAGTGATVCACEVLKASKLMHATDIKESLKQGDFNAITAMRVPNEKGPKV